MNPKSRIHLMIIFLILASLACGISDITGPVSAPDGPGSMDTEVAKRMAETASIQTAIAQGVADLVVPTQGGGAVGAPTVQGQVPSQAPVNNASPTVDKPMVRVSQVTNCRSGPGTSYDWLGTMNPGMDFEIFGKDPSNTSWYIKNPSSSSGYCWIWGTFASVTGNTAAVPVYTPMPTPTPAKTSTPTTPPIDFVVTFSEITFCGDYYIEFNITNIGSLTWQSYQSIVTDNDVGVSGTHQADSFINWDDCTVVLEQNDLSPGETGQTDSDWFAVNPAGHSMTATIKVCSENGLGGSCLSKTINFTP